MREAVSTTAETPLVARPRPLAGVRGWRLTIPRAAVDREVLLRALALFALWVEVGLMIGLVLVVARRRTPLAPVMNRGGEHGWLTGPLHDIAPFVPQHGFDLAAIFSGTLAATIVCYVVVVRLARRIPPRAGLGAIGLLHVLFLLAPVFILTDIFNYIDFARLGLLHGINPYTHGAAAAPHDPAFPLTTWHHMPTPYGPLFTVGTYALVPLGNIGAYWALKVLTVGASLGCLWLVWRCAQARGYDPLRAVMFVGLNPLLLVYGLGGVHNDFFMLLPVLGAMLLVLRGRELRAGVAAAVGPALKFSAGVFAPFILLGSRRRGPLLAGALVSGAVLFALGAVLFGTSYRGLHDQASVIVGPYSVPSEIGALFGLGIGPGLRLITGVCVALILALLVVRTWRGADWVAGAGWAGVVLAAGLFQPMPWYVMWALPFAALARSRPLRVATFALMLAMFINCTPQQNLILTHTLHLHGIGPQAGRATRALLR